MSDATAAAAAAAAQREEARRANGEFGEHERTAPAPDLLGDPPATSALEAAGDAWAVAFRESEEAAVDFMRTNLPADVASIEFDWSDQGEYIELTGFVMKDGSKLDSEGYFEEEREDGQSSPFYDPDEEFLQAARYIESPFDRGIEDVNSDGRVLRLTVTDEDRARPKVTWDQLEAAGQKAIDARRSVETTAVSAVRTALPEGVHSVVLEETGEGDALGFSSAFDDDGQPVEVYQEDIDEINFAAGWLSSSPDSSVVEAGLENHPESRRRDAKFIVRRDAS